MHIPNLHHLVDFVKLNFSNSPTDISEAVELRVHMDCPGCERRVRKALSRLKGIHSVEIDRDAQKVTVMGFVDKRKVLNRVRRKGKVADYWEPEAPPEGEEEELEEDENVGNTDWLYSFDTTLASDVPWYHAGGDMYSNPAFYNSRAHGPVVDALSEDNPNNCSIM